jgi:hypothetical protein
VVDDLDAANGFTGWKGGIPDLPGLWWPRFESGHLLLGDTTPATTPISALPLVVWGAEDYPRP